MTTYTLTELFDKRAICRRNRASREARQGTEGRSGACRATIHILRPGIELLKIVPKRTEYRPRYSKRGRQWHRRYR
jgi:hypothetical protein